MRRIAIILLVLGAVAAPAAARQRVALLAIEGKDGAVVRDAVEEILQHTATVLSESLFRSRQRKLGITTLTDDAYARLGADLAADAIVSGTLRRAGTRARLSLTVRSGGTGAVVNVIVVVVPREGLDHEAEAAIAAKLVPALAALLPGAVTTAEPVAPPADTAIDAAAPDVTDDAPPDTADAAPAADADAPDAAPATAAPTAADTSGDADEPIEPEGEGGLGPIDGKTFAYVRAPVDGGPFQQISASLWLHAKPRINEAASANLEAALDGIEASQTDTARLRLTLREAYVALRKRGWLVRAGRQIIPWGASDVVNPTDFLAARDVRMFAADPEQQRTGALSVLVSHASAHLEETIVATPLHPASVLIVPTGALPDGVTVAAPAVRAAAVEDTEVAAKLKVSGRSWDLALVGFRGWNHTPEFELVSADATGVIVRPTHHRILAAGLDGSASFGKLVVRIEAAYVRTDARADADPTIQPTYVFGVLGVERPLGERLRLQAQLIARAYPGWIDPAAAAGPDPMTTGALQGVAAANALLLDYQDRVRPAATVRVAYHSEDERLELEVFAAMNLVGHDYLIRPLLGWHPVEAVTVQLGFDGYGGYATTPLGALQPYGGAFAQVTYTF